MSADTVNLRIYDYDGVIDTSTTSSGNVIDSHPTFFKNEVADIASNEYETVIIGSFTNRGSLPVDCYNSHSNNTYSCLPSFAQIQHYLDQQFSNRIDAKQVSVLLDPLMMADLYDRRDDAYAGRSYAEGLKFFAEREKQNLETAKPENYFLLNYDDESSTAQQFAFDEKKFTILYTHLHRIAKKFPDKKIIVDVFDDREAILKYLNTVFSANPHFAPKNVHVKLHLTQKDVIVKDYEFQGTGKIDNHYDRTINKLAHQRGDKAGAGTFEAFSQSQIERYYELKMDNFFLDRNDDRVRTESEFMGYPQYYHADLSDFINTHQFQSNSNIVDANYTSARELIDNKLMKPEHFQPDEHPIAIAKNESPIVVEQDEYKIAIEKLKKLINHKLTHSNFELGWMGSKTTVRLIKNNPSSSQNTIAVPKTLFDIMQKLKDYAKNPASTPKEECCVEIRKILENVLAVKQYSKTNKVKTLFGCGRAQSTTAFYEDLLKLIPNQTSQSLLMKKNRQRIHFPLLHPPAIDLILGMQV